MRFGRQPRGHDPRIPRLSALIEGAAPIAVSADVDWTVGMPTDLGMMLNDQLGDCTCAGVYHGRQVNTFHTSGIKTPPDALVEKLYEEACGYVPGDAATDQGGSCQAVLTYWLNKGVPTRLGPDKLDAFFEVDVANFDELKRTIYECGFAYIGLNIPAWFANALNGGNVPQVWDVDPGGDNTIVDGHCVVLAAQDGAGRFKLASWGTWYEMTPAFFQSFCDEAYGPVSGDWMKATGSTPAGLTLAQWEAQMKALTP
jgi:hypothetical protein